MAIQKKLDQRTIIVGLAVAIRYMTKVPWKVPLTGMLRQMVSLFRPAIYMERIRGLILSTKALMPLEVKHAAEITGFHAN